jgi:hypothetical protein
MKNHPDVIKTKQKRPKPKFNLDAELIALGVQGEGSQDIVFPIEREFSKELNTWVYECELVNHYFIPIELEGSLPYPVDSIVFVQEQNLTNVLEDF